MWEKTKQKKTIAISYRLEIKNIISVFDQLRKDNTFVYILNVHD